VSIVSGEHGCEPAHVFPRGLGGCDDPLCVVPLTRGEHREYDLGELDLLPFLIAHGMVDELAHALGHARGDLLGLASILTGVRWVPEEAALVEVFREVRRVLRDDGTVWLNLGDSYAGSANSGGVNGNDGGPAVRVGLPSKRGEGIKSKDLIGIPWMVAFALRADGWYLRSDIIWNKPNPMPESVTDRPTKSHEYLFLLSKGPRYFWDADAVREEGAGRLDFGEMTSPARLDQGAPWSGGQKDEANGRNKRSVWTVATAPFSGAHFAVFPPKLIEPCVLAGSPPKCCGECGAPWRRVVEREVSDLPRGERSWSAGSATGQPQRDALGPPGNGLDVQPTRTVGWEATCTHQDDTGRSVVLDPFAGAGTTGVVALRHDRSFIGIELNPGYAEMARNRIRDDAPLLNTPLEAAA
jgi:DNA modification methylase